MLHAKVTCSIEMLDKMYCNKQLVCILFYLSLSMKRQIDQSWRNRMKTLNKEKFLVKEVLILY